MSILRVNTIQNTSGNATITNVGKVIQVQTGINTSHVQYSADQLSDGPDVNITPSSSSNKILIIGNISIGEGSGGDAHVFLYKDNSVLTGARGASSSGATLSTSGISTGRSAWDTQTSPVFYMDSPNTTSQVNYEIRCLCTNGPIALNRQQNGFQSMDNDNSHISYIIAMEISA